MGLEAACPATGAAPECGDAGEAGLLEEGLGVVGVGFVGAVVLAVALSGEEAFAGVRDVYDQGLDVVGGGGLDGVEGGTRLSGGSALRAEPGAVGHRGSTVAP